ncbi:CHASE4 domain-containing protein [uncultured Methanospirillum sp.]|uniref:CHASE4 domain-containing protein n=1 Tax=uncultured Methanospirillum sp. TaxID=262503 RepID=UPI0029C79356|nr:CHASE4 domain-containing protein [uncultured Methanospirillum sp.]
MRLYAQTILIIGITILTIAAILLVTFELTVMGSLSGLEQEYALEDLHRAENSVYGEGTRLAGISQDWGVWDDTYNYMISGNPEYISSNFAISTLRGLNLYSIALYNLNGTLVSGISTAQHNITSDPMPEDMVMLLQENPLLSGSPDGIHGIIMDDLTPLVVSSHPILNSEMQGPPHGTVVVASLLDNARISELSRNILQNITITPVSDRSSESLVQDVPGNNQIDNYQSIITDISGQPALSIKITERRDLSRSGIYSRIFLITSLLILTILFMGLASWLLNRIIISPLQDLNRDLLTIGNSGLLSGRIQTRRDDEIGDLATSINTMIGSFELAQRERISSEHRLARLVELVEEGICLIGPDNLIWFANPALASIFETTPHELTGRCPETLFSPHDPEDQIQGDCVTGMKPGHHELHTRTKSGRDIWIRVTLAPYPLETGRMGELCVVTDISQYRTAEHELLLSNKKLSLLGSMTRHDIVNQLTTIRGMLGLIRRKNADTSLTQLISSAEDAAEKINKHIEFSKEYQKAGIEKPRWQDLRTVWNLAYAMSRRKGLTFTVNGENYEIYADQLLQKVFYNLIENSLKHGKNVFYITISTQREGTDLLIIYSDDGGGIPDTMKDRIFERGVGAGTGWGLFFAKEVLSLTGMDIRESGTFGIGAEFVITVPEEVFRPVPGYVSDSNPEDDPGNEEHDN